MSAQINLSNPQSQAGTLRVIRRMAPSPITIQIVSWLP